MVGSAGGERRPVPQPIDRGGQRRGEVARSLESDGRAAVVATAEEGAQPGAPACTVDAVGESMPAWRFEFRATPTGLVLDAVIEVNSVYDRADEARVLARLRARARPAACTP